MLNREALIAAVRTGKIFLPLGLLFAFLVFALGASERSIWYDEAITLNTLSAAEWPSDTTGLTRVAELRPLIEDSASPIGVVEKLIEYDVHPPIYFVGLDLWAGLFGTSLFAVRLLSVVCSVLAIYLFYRLAVENKLDPPWLYTGVFGASFLVASAAAEARWIAAVILLSVITLRLYWRGYRHLGSDTRTLVKNEMGLGIACAALFLTHYFGAFLIATIMGIRVVRMYRATTPLITFTAPLVGLILVMPWLPVAIDHMGARPNQGSGFVGLIEMTKTIAKHMMDVMVSASLYNYPKQIAWAGKGAVAIGIMTSAIVLGFRLLVRPRTEQGVPLSSALLLTGSVLLYCLLMIVTDKNLFEPRYFAATIAPMSILVAYGLLQAGAFLDRNSIKKLGVEVPQFALAPAVALLVIQISALNFGYENNRSWNGNYWKTLHHEVSNYPNDKALIIIDRGVGRGTLLSAVASLDRATELFVLPRNSEVDDLVASNIERLIENREFVAIAFTISHGTMGDDKMELFPLIREALTMQGFDRHLDLPEARAMHVATWSREQK